MGQEWLPQQTWPKQGTAGKEEELQGETDVEEGREPLW